jgi:hypothetical protein
LDFIILFFLAKLEQHPLLHTEGSVDGLLAYNIKCIISFFDSSHHTPSLSFFDELAANCVSELGRKW